MVASQKPLEEHEVLKNVRFLAFNALIALKHFYSFRELEKELNISAQVLWRYLSLRVVPEKDTAQKILDLIRQKKLIERALQMLKMKVKEPWELYTHTGVLFLTALKALEILRNVRFEATLAAPDPYSHISAAVVAVHTRTKLCIPTRYPIMSANSIITVYEARPEVYDVAILPRRCLEKDMATLLLASIASREVVDVLLTLTQKVKFKPIGLLAISGNYDEIRKLINEKNVNLQYVVVLLEDIRSSIS